VIRRHIGPTKQRKAYIAEPERTITVTYVGCVGCVGRHVRSLSSRIGCEVVFGFVHGHMCTWGQRAGVASWFAAVIFF
jgi:hypothetical protein